MKECVVCHQSYNKLLCKQMCSKCYKKAEYRKNHETYKRYRNTHKKQIDEYNKQYYLDNKEQEAERMKRYREQNIEHIREYDNNYRKTRRQYDELYRCRTAVRNHIQDCITNRNSFGTVKNRRTEEILGCSFDEFKQYIEDKFDEGMTWLNHGEWHLDHIIPLASAQTIEDVYTLCHYTNYQPLWAKDNLKKGAKMPDFIEGG